MNTHIGTPIVPKEGNNSLHSSPATSDGYELVNNPDRYSENTKDGFVELKRYQYIFICGSIYYVYICIYINK
jgi:hypothetical protein